ncbi:MAG: hypothetical protein E6772_07765 [Dysgonomonas sp.]|nr:hypothetical protein [Dysgonomonas sp.]
MRSFWLILLIIPLFVACDDDISESGGNTIDWKKAKIKSHIQYVENEKGEQVEYIRQEYEYNSQGKLCEEKYYENGQLKRLLDYTYEGDKETYTYTFLSSGVEIGSGRTSTIRKYDKRGNLILVEVYNGKDFKTVQEVMAYDSQNRLIGKDVYRGDSILESQTYYHEYTENRHSYWMKSLGGTWSGWKIEKHIFTEEKEAWGKTVTHVTTQNFPNKEPDIISVTKYDLKGLEIEYLGYPYKRANYIYDAEKKEVTFDSFVVYDNIEERKTRNSLVYY